MTLEEAKNIIDKENYKYYNLFEDRPLKENEVGICKNDNGWKVFTTDERASIVTNSVVEFNNESDALDRFMKRVATEKILYNDNDEYNK